MAFAAALPAIIGGAGGLLGGLFSGKSKRREEREVRRSGTPKGYDTFSPLAPEQQSLLAKMISDLMGQQTSIAGSPLYQAGQSHIQNILGGDTSAFEAPFMRQFQEQIIPGLAERFSGAGAGAQSSSAFQQALGGAGADLAERLAALRGGLQMQALPQALNYANAPAAQALSLLGITSQGFQPKQVPGWQQALVGLSGGVGKGLGAGLTSPDFWKWLGGLGGSGASTTLGGP